MWSKHGSNGGADPAAVTLFFDKKVDEKCETASKGGHHSWLGKVDGGRMACARYERNRDERSEAAKQPWNKKTRLCKRWKHTGTCPYGDDCNFAHGAQELRVWEEWDDDQWKDHDKVNLPIWQTHF